MKKADMTACLMTLERLQEAPTREAIELALSALLNHRWGVVRGEAGKCLSKLANVEFLERGNENELQVHLQQWWRGAQANWQAPADTSH